MANYSDQKCQLCPYHDAKHLRDTAYHGRTAPLSMEASTMSSSVLIVAQAPGVNEWSKGRPLQAIKQRKGAIAGRRLELSLRRVSKKYKGKIKRGNLHLTNSVQCYPGKGNDDRDKAPSAAAQSHCIEWLKEDIRRMSPTYIVTFGDIASRQVGQALQALGLAGTADVIKLKHPSGGLTNNDFDEAWVKCFSL